MANTIGTAYVQIKPSTEGIGGAIKNALNKDASDAGASAGGKLSSALGTAAKIGTAAIGATTAAMVAFGKSAVDAGKSFDASMSQVAATMGYSTEELNDETSEAAQTMEKLGTFAQEMGSTTAFSASQAADALNYMALAGYDAETSMSMLPNVLNLAAAGGIELASASDMITDAQSALGLSLDETSIMVDQMAKASSKSNTSIAQLGEAFLTVGGTAKNLQGGTAELSAALGVLANNGIKGSEGGTALRNILLSLTPKSDAAAESMEALGFNAYDADGELRPLSDTFNDLAHSMEGMSTLERQNHLGAMFNKVDLKSVNAMLAAASDGVNKLSYALEASSVDWGKYSSLPWMQGEDAMNSFAEQVQYSLVEVGSTMEETAQFLADEYDLALDDALLAVQTVSENLGDATSSWEDLEAAIIDSDNAAQNMADVQLDNLQGDITLFQSALEGAQIAVAEGLTPSIREFVQFGANGLSELTAAFKEGGLNGAMEAAGNIISNLVSKVLEMLPSLIDAGIQLLNALIRGILDNLPKIIEAAIKIIETIADYLIDSLPELIPAIVDIMLTIIDTLIDNLDMLVDASIKIIVALAEGIIKALPKLIEKAPVIIAKFVAAINANAPKLLVLAGNLIATLVSGVVKSIPSVGKAAINVAKALIDGVAGFVVNMASIGGNLVTGLWNGINDKVAWIVEKIKGFGTTVINSIKGIFGIHSPSKIMKDEVGKYLSEGIAVGIDANADSVTNAMENLKDKTLDFDMISGNFNYDLMPTENTENLPLNQILELLKRYLPYEGTQQIVLDSGALVGQIARQMDNAIGSIASKEKRGVYV